MRILSSKKDVAFMVFVAVAVIALAVGLFSTRGASPPASLATSTSQGNAITRENALLGTSSWMIPDKQQATTQIQAYTSATSVSPGQKLTFYVSTQREGTPYSIGIYRLGWYAGLGGRLVASQANLVGHAQGYYDLAHQKLVDCNSCHVDPQTGLVEANWQPSYTITVPSDWTTGVYLAKFADSNGMETYAPFDVLGNVHSTYVAVTPDTTYQAYNTWGGYSLYEGPEDSTATGEVGGLSKGVKVSFDRPYVGSGASQVLTFEIDAIRWFERQGYDMSYISNINLQQDPGQLLQHRAYISLGHDEYWTKEMRDGVRDARDHGVGLIFLGANAAYWQMRFEPDSADVPDRTVVCYKVLTGDHDLALDPFYGKDNSRVTSQWRDPVLNRPENALIGIMYSSYIQNPQAFPWQVSPTAKSPLLDGTGLQPGQEYGCGVVGYEWDHVFDNGATPPGLQILATSKTISAYKTADFSNTTYYIAPSGAMVFATGSIYWTAALDSYRESSYSVCANKNPVVPGMQKLLANVMKEVVIRHPSQQLTLTAR
jgi:hypothetical protein